MSSNEYQQWYRATTQRGKRLLRVNAAGTQRRIRALMWMGWSSTAIARHGGWNAGISVQQLLRRRWVSRETAARINRAYDALSMRFGPSTWTRTYAARSGWAPPLAWDDDPGPHYIDDPAARPSGVRGSRGQGAAA